MNGATPKQRAKNMKKVLAGLYAPHGGCGNVAAMLTDLRHLCAVEGWDFAALDKSAYRTQYLIEKEAQHIAGVSGR